MRIVADRDEMFEGDIEALDVLADQDEIYVFVATAGNHGLDRSQIGIKLELLSQANVDGAESAADRRRQWPLQRQPGAPDAVDEGSRQWIAATADAGHAALLKIPFERRSQRIEHTRYGFRDFGTDAVAGYQGCWNFFGHGAITP